MLRQGFKKLFALYDDARETCRNKSVQAIWTLLLGSVFQELGFTAQPSKGNDKESTLNAYYRLFAASSPVAAKEKPLALCLTYPWERNLDGKDEQRDDQTPDENPGAVVVTLLDTGEADWAIVTNGVIWRLYAAKAHSRATNYYEINLQETLALDPSKRIDAFRYFWLFFRAAAFTSTERIVEGETRRLNLLDGLLLQSDLYARQLGDRLKNRVFEEIFPQFALGFVNHARQHDLLPAHLDTLPVDERNRLLEPYFTGTLTFLYRLLFLLYAESRDLLPVRQERSYYEQSLERLKQEVAKNAGKLQDRVASNLATYSESSTAIYDRLVVLFAAVDKGNAVLNVPIYNGGLFMTNPPAPTQDEPQEMTVARFLKDHKITDRQLALGLDLMARDVDEKLSKVHLAVGEANNYSHELIFIDYKSLGVRHLGSIYEGLLEFKLRVAPEAMAVVEGKRTEEVISYSDAKQQNRRILKVRQGKELKERLYNKGMVYLENDRHERKATGSYYTPDYIVQYIVEQTVGPILKDKLEKLRVVFRAAQEYLQKEQAKLKALQRTDMDAELHTYNAYRVSLNEAFFDLKVLDPAMGSGHFLVEVVDYITDQLAKFLNGFTKNPVVYELARTRKRIEDGMREQGVTVDRDKLTDLNLLKRRVLKSCVYGVDLNPMAVELAKVSLWLDCFTLGAPLSFLDHHMKCGNSLIGADVKAVHIGISENLFGYKFESLLNAAQLMRGVSKLSDVTAKEVAESHDVYQQAFESLAPYKRLFDIWLSQYFGNKKAQDVANQHSQAIIDNDYVGLDAGDMSIINAALPLAASKRFLHWELEFPEVFFDDSERKINGGFDVVVGNPPYGLITNIEDKKFYQNQYSSVEYQPDFYVVFVERCVKIAHDRGGVGLIIPTTYIGMHYFSKLRHFMLTNTKPIKLLKLRFPVFEDATVESSITILQTIKQIDQENITGQGAIYDTIESFTRQDKSLTTFSVSDILQTDDWDFNFLQQDSQNSEVFTKKLRLSSLNLDKTCEMTIGVKPYQTGKGVPKQTSQIVNDRVFDASYKKDKTYHRYLMGRDIGRYEISPETERWIAYGDWLAEPRRSAPFFSPSKILVRQTGDSIIATYDTNQFITLNNLHNLKINKSFLSELYILALLNSKLATYYHRSQVGETGRVFAEIKLVDLGKLPVHSINFTTSPSERARCLDKAKLLYQQCVSKDDQDCVLGFVNHHLAKEPEESDVVHDLLAFLAEEMLRLNKEKRALQKAFLDYFVDAMLVRSDNGKVGIEVLTGKSKLLEFAGDYQKGEGPLAPDALWEIVQKNRSKLNAGRVGLKERVLAHYQESLDQVLPLKEQLRRTDALIDQVVYLLYGLTQEEIAIVEGKG